MCINERESRERKKKRHLDDLFSSEYVESTIDEKKKRRRKKKERRETRGNFDKSLASQALAYATCWQERRPFVTINSRVAARIIAMFDSENDLWVRKINR